MSASTAPHEQGTTPMSDDVRAVLCTAYGPPNVVSIGRVPVPVSGPGEAVVQVHAAAINYPDVLVIADRYQVSAPLPFVPGSELAGIVTAIGDDVASDPSGVRVGDRVFGIMFVGAFAEQVALPASNLTTVDADVDMRLLAAFGVAYITAYHALRSIAEVQQGEWVVVLGAAGGVGLAAVELAAVMGAHVIAAASTPEKLELCAAKGAEQLIDYTTEDLKGRIRSASGDGAHVIIDPVGGSFAESALRGLAWGGRFVSVGFASGEIPRIPLNLVLLKGVAIRGMEFTGFTSHRPEEAERNQREVLDLLVSGAITPHISQVYPLERCDEALTMLAERRATGKVVIDLTAHDATQA